MLIDAKTIEGLKIQATDGAIGEVDDILFDDASWTVRYFVVNTGTWFNRERVLLSPESFRGIDWDHRSVVVGLKRQQVKDSPDVSTNLPVSRFEEERLRGYYAWPTYWGDAGLGGEFGAGVMPGTVPSGLWTMRPPPVQRGEHEQLTPLPAREPVPEGNPHLRSARELRGYGIGATDGEIGHVEDVQVDDSRWTIAEIVVDTTNWWPGGNVAMSPEHVREVRWADHTLAVDLTRQQVKEAPEVAAGHHR